jgi:hypothetical protein
MGRRRWEALGRSCNGDACPSPASQASISGIANPAFNRDRGPVWAISVRLHIELGKDSFSANGKH